MSRTPADIAPQVEPVGNGGNSVGEDGEPVVDSWIIRGDYVVRKHVVPRQELFAPYDADDAPPVPLADIDCYRWTVTDSEFANEKDITDSWDYGTGDHRKLSTPWTGETRFLRPPLLLQKATLGSMAV